MARRVPKRQGRRAKRRGTRSPSRISSRVAKTSSTRYRAPRPSSLSPKQLKKRAAALAAHSDMLRDRNLTASEAAKNNGVTVRDLRTYIPKAFKKDASGRIHAIADRYVRRMEVPGPDGPIVIKIRGSKAKSEVARFRNDVFSFLEGNRSALDKWKGVRIQGHELLTAPRIIRILGEQDNLPEHFGSEQIIPYSGGAT